MRRALWITAAAALAAVLVIGLTQAGGKDAGGAATAPPFDLDAALARLEGAPTPLAGLHDQANQLLDGDRRAFEDRLARLRGHPVVVNKWASWCRPCRAEFPVFERVATARGKSVAFIGVNGKDKEPAARRFLDERPLPYPSYQDPGDDIGAALKTPAAFPITVFIDRRGDTAFMHAGEYTSAAQLERDIDHYLG